MHRPIRYMDEKAYNDLSRYIKKLETEIPDSDVVQEKLNAVNATKGKEAKHKYCNSCMLCDKVKGKCLANTIQLKMHHCFLGRNYTILKEKGLYGQRVKKNRLT